MQKSYSLKEIAKLINICKNKGVFAFKYNGLEISMTEPDRPVMTPGSHARGSAKKAEEITTKQDLQSQYDLVAEAVETLHVEDPAAFERMLINGELDEAKEN